MTEEINYILQDQMANELHKVSIQYIFDKLLHDIFDKLLHEGPQDTSDLINIVLNAHLHSLTGSMILLSSTTEPPNSIMRIRVTNFIEKLVKFVSDNVPKTT